MPHGFHWRHWELTRPVGTAGADAGAPNGAGLLAGAMLQGEPMKRSGVSLIMDDMSLRARRAGCRHRSRQQAEQRVRTERRVHRRAARAPVVPLQSSFLSVQGVAASCPPRSVARRAIIWKRVAVEQGLKYNIIIKLGF